MLKVLLLCNSNNISEQLRSLFYKYFDDVEIQHEANALEGVFKLAELNPQAVLVDHSSCEFDVFQVISLMKSNDWTMHIPVLLLINREDLLNPQFLPKSHEVQVDGFLYKPLNPLEALPLIRMTFRLIANESSSTPASISENRYQSNSIKNGFFLNEVYVDSKDSKQHSRFVQVNKRFETLTGLSTADIMNKEISEIFPDIEPQQIASLLSIVNNKTTFKFQEYLPRTNKKLEIFAFCPQKDKIAAFVSEIGDNGSGLHSQSDNIDLIEESERLKDSFLANLSHEIRTPLNAIMGFSTLLGFDDIQEDKKHLYLRQIRKSGTSLLTIIEEMLDLSKIQSGHIELNYCSFNLKMVLLNVARRAKSVLNETEKSNDIELQINVGSTANDIWISTDKKRVEQVITKLVDNAIKFTEKGYIKIECNIEKDSNTGKRLTVEVEDTGIGIPQNMFENIFGLFRQIEGEQTLKYGGTGIGLSVSRKIVNMLGGEMWVESNIGKGSTFHFTIPITISSAVMEMAHFKDKSHSGDIPVPDWSNKKILIADDEEMNLFFLEEMLHATNIKILYAENGIEVLEQFEANPSIDIILMDMRMPFQDGYETAKRVKKLRADVPIVAQTTLSKFQDKSDIYEAGCDACLEKPISQVKLFEELSRFLGAAR